MHKIRSISIPEGSEKNLTKEYYRKACQDMADEFVLLLKVNFAEKYGFEFKK